MTTLAAFKRLVEPGDRLRCIAHEYIPDRVGEEFVVDRVGPTVMDLTWHDAPYRFEWPAASAVVVVSEDRLAYILTNRKGQFLIHHQLVKVGENDRRQTLRLIREDVLADVAAIDGMPYSDIGEALGKILAMIDGVAAVVDDMLAEAQG